MTFLLAMPMAVSAADPVKVGYVLPLSGSAAASIGQEFAKGAMLGARHVNEAGGIQALGGAEIQLVLTDSRGDPQVAMTEVERLITVERVPLLMGAFQSAVTLPATTVAERYGVPWIVDMAAEKSITERGFRYIFRPTQVPSSSNADSVVDFVVWIGEQTGRKAQTAAIVYENTDWGQDLANRLRQRFTEAGIRIVLDESYPPDSPNLRPLVLKLAAARADVISVTAYATDAIQIHSLIEQMGVNAMAVIGSGAGQVDATFVPSVGERGSNYVFSTNGWAGPASTIVGPFAERFWNDYIAAYGEEPVGEFPVVGYALMWLVKDVLERAGSADPDAIRDALASTEMRNNEVTRLLGYDIVFDATGQNQEKRFVMQQIKDGVYYTVWPEHVAVPGYEVVWPVPPWSDR